MLSEGKKIKKKKTKKRLLSLFLSLVLVFSMFLCTQKTKAQGQLGPVFFNELMWRGSSIVTENGERFELRADEWIELYNDSDEIVDLSGWTIFDATKKKDDKVGGIMVKIEKGQIAPKSYFLIAHNDKDHLFLRGESVLNITPDIIDGEVSLNNNQLWLGLCSPAGCNMEINSEGKKKIVGAIDEAGNGGKPFFYESRKWVSLERAKYENGSLKENWREAELAENLDDGIDNIANPQNSGKPKITNFKFSSNVFLKGKENKYSISYKIEDSKKDFEKLSLQVFDRGKVVDLIKVPLSGSKIKLNYQFCPTIIALSQDSTGLQDEFPIDLKCAFLNNKLKINEVMPHPKQKDWNKDGRVGVTDEWIELYNGAGEKTKLSGWMIKDKSGNKFLLDNLTIEAKSYLVLKNMTKISINDDGDTIYLIDPLGKQIDIVNIPKSTNCIDIPYARFGTSWQWSGKATPRGKNQLVPIEEEIKDDDDKDQASKPAIKTQKINTRTKNNEGDESKIKRTIITTTTIKRSVPAILASNRIAPIVLGSKIRRNDTSRAFIRFEYLLYFFGFITFILLVSCYEVCRRE